jgi:ectoine hydroxylase-related dioxygenase (phytanoyl-CoA dioxygenase family)
MDQELFDRDGHCVVDGVVPESELSALGVEFDRVLGLDAGHRAGVRSPLALSDLFKQLAASPTIRFIIESILGENVFIVRSLLFDKRDGANWNVAWHRDTTITVKERIETPGYGPWSIKDGVVHVRPPVRVLENMLTLRIHLDDCDETNGALRVVPGSHKLKDSDPSDLDRLVDVEKCRRVSILCRAVAGSALAMRPLLLHASNKATIMTRRRVVHLEFASNALDGDLQWAAPIPCRMSAAWLGK